MCRARKFAFLSRDRYLCSYEQIYPEVCCVFVRGTTLQTLLRFRVLCLHSTTSGYLKDRWSRFQARAPPLSFIEGRAIASPLPSIYTDINMHDIYYVISLASVVKPHTVKLSTVRTSLCGVFFIVNRCFSEIRLI